MALRDGAMRRRTRAALAGFGYGMFLLLWALWAAGLGHGTFLPLGLVGSPFSPFLRVGFIAAPFWWALIGYAIGRRSTRAALALVGVHALGSIVCLIRGTPWESAGDQWAQLSSVGMMMPLVWLGLAVYGAGLAVAVALARSDRQTRD